MSDKKDISGPSYGMNKNEIRWRRIVCYFFASLTFKIEMTGETPEVRSDKRKPREKKREKKWEKMREKREKEREKREK